jgi:hypothetical protein
MPMERHDMCLGNVPRGREKDEEKNTFLKSRRIWKQRKQKEDKIL